jgi:hypothetical protein
MTPAVQTMPDSARQATTVHALRAEAYDYQRFTTMLQGIRRLFARNEHTAAREACEALLMLSRDLQQRATDRAALCGLKMDGEEADNSLDVASPEYGEAYRELLRAQTHARTELVATMDIIADLRAHTAALRNVLQGRSPSTYEHLGAQARSATS